MAITLSVEETELGLGSVKIAYEKDKVLFDFQLAKASKEPRDEEISLIKAIKLATVNEGVAKSCIYSLPIKGGKPIRGASVHLARIVAQSWGNLRAECNMVDVYNKGHVTYEAICIDFETNVAIRSQVKRSVLDRFGRKYNEDIVTSIANATNAIALRTAILSVVPKYFIDAVCEAIVKKVTGDISDKALFLQKRNQLMQAFKDAYDITDKQILSVVSRRHISEINEEDLVVLIGVAQGIADGDVSIESTFQSKLGLSEVKEGVFNKKQVEKIKIKKK